MKKKVGKLTLHRETLCNLEDSGLAQAAGGAQQTTVAYSIPQSCACSAVTNCSCGWVCFTQWGCL